MRPLPAWVVTACAAVIATSSAVIALGNRSPQVTSYATTSPGIAVLSSVTGAALFAAAALLAQSSPTRTGAALATFGLGTAWSADAWAGWSGAPTAVRNTAMLLVPMLAPAALLAVGSVLGRRAAAAAVVVGAVGIASAVALWLVRDPFLDRYCWRDCLVHSFAPFPDAKLARTATNVDLVVSALCGGFAAAVCAGAFVRPRMRPIVAASVSSGCALAVSSLVLRLEPAEDPTRPLYASLFMTRSACLLGLAAALAYVALRPVLLRRAISRLATDPSRAGGRLEAALADAIGVRGMRLGYPLSAERRVVDADGRPVELDPSAARIARGGEVVALVDAPSGPPPAGALERALGPGARLALANERLRAEQLFRLHELTELRRRIVATRDETRRRLERDLHDGAQQRLLAVGIDLRVALKRAEAAARPQTAALLREAAALVEETTRDLRSVAHGIFPATLASAGLAAALESLADERPLVLSIAVGPGRRFPSEIEVAAYALVAEATAGTRAPARVRAEEHDSKLFIAVDGAAGDGGDVFADDRVGAAGGTLTRTGRRLEAVFPAPPAH